MKKGTWNYDTCITEARKYTCVSDFRKNSGGAYKAAWKNGWLKDYTFFQNPSLKWDHDACYAEAKKYEYRQDFKNNSGGAYNSAKSNGWLSEYTWLKTKIKPKNYWTREHCLAEARKYKSYHDFHSSVAYQKAMNEGWLEDYSWFNDYPKETPSYETCREEALKFQTLKDYRENGIYYNTASHKGYLDSFVWLKKECKPNGYWNYETCYEEAKKYKNRWAFEQGSPGAKHVAMKNGWIDDYDWFDTKREVKWNESSCRTEAEKYTSVWDFRTNSPGAYNAAYRNNWMYDYHWLFKTSHKKHKFNLLNEFEDEYALRAFLSNNDINILFVVLRNIEPKFEPIKNDIEFALRHAAEEDPIQYLVQKYSTESDNEPEQETIQTEQSNTIDLDNDDDVYAALGDAVSETNENETELTIEDIIRNDEQEIQVINRIEHMLTPEVRNQIMSKFLNDKRRFWIYQREKFGK